MIGAIAVVVRDRFSHKAYSLRLKWVYDPGFAGELVAKHEGFFDHAGIPMDIRPGGFEADPVKLVASGADTFGVCGADSFLLAREAGVPIVAFAAGYLQTPVVFYAKADGGIKAVTDFAGKRVGVQAGQDTETIYAAMLQKHGLKRENVKEVPVKYDFSPFLDGLVDVWPGYAATQSYVLNEKHIAYRIITPAESGIAFIGTVYFSSESFVREHPDKVQKFLDAVITGWELAYSNRQVAVTALESYDPATLTKAVIDWNLDKQAASIRPEGRRFCELRSDELAQMSELLRQQGIMKNPVDIRAAFDDSFLQRHYK